MAITKISVSLKDSAIGTITPRDGVAAIIYGATVASGSSLQNIPHLFTSMDDYNAWIKAATDADSVIAATAANASLALNVARFYDKAGSGAYLWVLMVSGNNGDFVTPNVDTIKSMIYLTKEGNYNNRPRLLGFVSSTNDTIAEGIVPTTLPTTVSAIQTMIDSMFEDSIRMNAVISTSVDASQITVANIPTSAAFAAYNAPSVAVLTTTTVTNPAVTDSIVPIKDVGEVLGIQASIMVSTSIGSCSLPSVAQTAYYTVKATAPTVTNIASVPKSIFEALGENQVLFHRTRPQLEGVYYNDGATCNAATNALSKLDMVRLGNVVCDDVEAYFVKILNTQIAVDANGNIAANAASQLETGFYNQYAVKRISQGQCSNISVKVAAQDSNLVSTKTLLVSVKIQPSPNVEQVIAYVMYVTTTE